MRELKPIIHRIERVAIVMPARDEAPRIGPAIEALAAAVARIDHRVRTRLCVVDDGSTDETAAAAEEALAALSLARSVGWSVVRSAGRGAPLARRLGVARATSGWTTSERTWLLSTDADSRVRPDWILRHLRHADRGAPAVAGIVDVVPDRDSVDFVERWRRDYGSTIGRDATHPHAHAANLGVRHDAYLRVGGFRPCRGAEDTDLWRRLRHAGIEPVADASIVVDTSGRRAGRVSDGFAWALSQLYPPDLVG